MSNEQAILVFLGLVVVAIVICGLAANVYRPWWYKTKTPTKYGTWTTEEGILIKYRIMNEEFVIDSVTGVLDAIHKTPAVVFGEPFTLYWTEGARFAEMKFVSAVHSEGIYEAVARDTATIESRDPDV